MTTSLKVRLIYPRARHQRLKTNGGQGYTLIFKSLGGERLAEGKSTAEAWKNAWTKSIHLCPHDWAEKTHYTTNFHVAYAATRKCRICKQKQVADFCEGRVGGPWRVILPKNIAEDDPIKNQQGSLCGLCDSTSEHVHPTLRCKRCNVAGLAENMRYHVCKPKK